MAACGLRLRRPAIDACAGFDADNCRDRLRDNERRTWQQTSGCEHFSQHFRALGGDRQQRAGCTRGLTPALFPLLQGALGDSEHACESGLRKTRAHPRFKCLTP